MHTITWLRGGTDHNGADWEDEQTITFKFRRGAPEQGPSYASGGQPADPHEVEFVSISPGAGHHGVFQDVADKLLRDEAEDWLSSDGYDEAVAIAAEDDEAARDDAAEMAAELRAEDRAMGWDR